MPTAYSCFSFYKPSYISESIGSPIVERCVPETFGCDSYSLSFKLADNDLDCEFVSGHFDFYEGKRYLP